MKLEKIDYNEFVPIKERRGLYIVKKTSIIPVEKWNMLKFQQTALADVTT